MLCVVNVEFACCVTRMKCSKRNDSPAKQVDLYYPDSSSSSSSSSTRLSQLKRDKSHESETITKRLSETADSIVGFEITAYILCL